MTAISDCRDSLDEVLLAVLVPVYNKPEDEFAIKQFKSCFNTREVVPINCEALIRQGGSLHCLTMQLPEGFLNLALLS